MDGFKYEYILVRYGELSTKGKNRKDFINCLYRNIRQALNKYELEYEKTYDGIYIHLNDCDYSAVSDSLKKVFGYAYFAGAIRVASELDLIKEAAYQVAINSGKKTFKVITKRNDKNFPHHSDEVNRAVAGRILSSSDLKVDVHNPELKLNIIIKKDVSFIMDNKVEGFKGYPVGVNQKALLMLSGGIDSPVAGFKAMRRGMRLECIHFEAMPYTSKQALDKVLDLAKLLSVYQGEIKVHVVPFGKLQLEIYKHCDESYAITLLRRMMYRIADKLCKQRNILTIVNGESVGQVASQTPESLQVISSVCETLIMRPLCMEDKLDIIDWARRIGTYETSILPYEDCCTIFSPKNPTTKPKAYKCERYESKFDYETLIDECLENINIVTVKPEVESDLL